MNAVVKTISGSFNVVRQIPDSKIDALAQLLGLSEDEKKGLKGGDGLVVIGPLSGGKAGS